MGHFRIRRVPASDVGRDASIGIRMTRPPEPVIIERGARDFGEAPCVAAFNAWNIVSDPTFPIEGQPVSYTIVPTEASVLCEGDCLDWVMGLTCEGANVTIEPMTDCVGVVVTFDDSIDVLRGCTATLDAALTTSGAHYGTTINLTPFPTSPFRYSDQAGVLGTDIETWTEAMPCEASFWGGETWVVTSPEVDVDYTPSLFAWNVTQSGSNFTATPDFDLLGRPILIVSAGVALDEMCGEWIKAEPTYDGEPANGPLEWSVDAAP